MNKLGDRMNKRILALTLMCVSVILFVPLTQAGGPSDVVTVWTDKPMYSAGQAGKLYITYNNVRDAPVEIRRITVVFDEWWAFINNAWVGNLTYEPTEVIAVTAHTTRVFEISFTVPSDGRATSTSVDIKVYTNLPLPDTPDPPKPTISVAEPIFYMEQIVTLFTVQVVLIIVCTIIMAATIFLSARRPQVMWRKEERAE